MISFPKHNKHISLVPLDPDHSEEYREARNDYATWRWCRQDEPISELQQDAWMKRQDADPTVKMYEINHMEERCDHDGSPLPVGVCGFTDIDYKNQRAEFSLYIMPEFRRKGYAGKSLKVLFRHGFQNLNFNMIWGETMDGNPAATIFEKIGMKNTGYRPDFYFKEGKYWNASFWCMKREGGLK